MRLRIGYLSTFYHTSILMQARGTVPREMGGGAAWRLFGTGPAIIEAFGRGELDMAYIGLPPAIIGIDRGVNIKCVAGGHVEGTVISGRNRFRGFPEISSLDGILRQFTGLAIGVPGRGSIHDVIISTCLADLNLDSQIAVRHFTWADQVLEAVHRGDVSAAVGTPALAAAVVRYAGGTVLYPPSRLWPNNPSCGILVDAGYLKGARDTVEQFLTLHEDAESFLRERPDEAAKIISHYVGVAEEGHVLDALKISPRYCACLTDAYMSSTMEFVQALRKLGYIRRELSAREIFDTSLIDKIHPEKDHYGTS